MLYPFGRLIIKSCIPTLLQASILFFYTSLLESNLFPLATFTASISNSSKLFIGLLYVSVSYNQSKYLFFSESSGLPYITLPLFLAIQYPNSTFVVKAGNFEERGIQKAITLALYNASLSHQT